MMMDSILKLLKHASLGLLVIGVLIALKMFGGKKQPASEGTLALASQAPGADKLLPADTTATDPQLLRTRITHALQENPEEVKRLFLSWVEGEKERV